MRRVAAAAAVALIAVTAQGSADAQPRQLKIEVLGPLRDDQARGVELGVAEMQQTAQLLGTQVTLEGSADAGDDGAVLIGQIASRPVEDGRTGAVPVVYLDAPASAACEFTVRPGRAGETWHPSLFRYGAAQLNERFTKRFSRGMTSGAWNGWMAVKALVESALRARSDENRCAALAALRLDGHKGVPLSFDPQTRELRQPLYVIENERVVREVK